MRLLIVTVLTAFLINCQGPSPVVVGIQPFDDFDKSLTDTLVLTIKKVYGFDVVVLPEKSLPLPQQAFINTKTPRYRADTIIHEAKRTKPDTIDYIIGLTHKDISCTKTDRYGKIKEPAYKYADWGIFGLGYRPGPCCVVSTYRLKCLDNKLFVLRFKKVCVHELGHNLGLPHCTSPKCVMQDAAETIKTVDNVDLVLCERCWEKINTIK